MRELTHQELASVSGGELQCTGGIGSPISGFYCTGTITDWMEAVSDVYDALVGTATDLLCSATGKC